MSLNQNLEFSKICRLCMSNDNVLISIFTSQYNSNLLFSDMIMSMSTVKITTDELLPSCICLKCIDKVLQAYSFKLECEKSEKILRDYLRKKTRHENTYKSNNKPEIIPQIGKKLYCATQTMSEHLDQEDSEKTNEEATSQISSVNIFKCFYCDQVVLTEDTLKRHIASKHYTGKGKQSNNSIQKIQNQCSFCYYAFENKQNLKKHLLAKHLIVNNNHGRETSGTCNLCGLESINLNYHLNEHYKHLYCNKCKMKFDDRQEFEDHMKEEMSASTSSNIIINNTKIFSNTVVQNKKINTTTDIYECPHCKIIFSTYAGLKSHLRVHLQCAKCGKSYTTNAKYVAHMRTHTEHLYKCKDCNQYFRKAYQLTHHYLIHAGEHPGDTADCDICKKKINKRHLCDTCGKSFQRLDNFKSHLAICAQ